MKADYYMLRLARFTAGYTQAELAELAGISTQTVRKAERGGDISASSHGKIKKALGLK